MASRIPIRVSNGKGFVWNVDDIYKLRAEHRICGILVGTLPHMGSQNMFLGLPLQLMPEEVVLLLNEELALLVDDPSAHMSPTQEQLEKWKERHAEYVESQISSSTTSGDHTHLAETAEAKQKRLLRQQKKNAKTSTVQQEPNQVLWIPEETPETSSSKAQDAPYPLVVPGETSFPWYDSTTATYLTIQSAKDAGIWNYPDTQEERARCAVFSDLWKRKYVMGGGIKFGGEYLVYPGDPLRYHSHYTASVLPSVDNPLPAMDVVAHGRLGTATKKVHVLSAWDEKKQEVAHFSIEWAGFG
ncbi:hypothetical protein DL96DRAFT_1703191 [Flagelloscypha sp. PMI_526]|nr:hypothetical protein DL96DRAFT_1703191 [Flagelloscypha sp. PMI_526]